MKAVAEAAVRDAAATAQVAAGTSADSVSGDQADT
jgi:hypothetical protein